MPVTRHEVEPRELGGHETTLPIAPAIFGTPMLFSMSQEVQDALAADVPFPSRLGKPEDSAKLVQQIITNDMPNVLTVRQYCITLQSIHQETASTSPWPH